MPNIDVSDQQRAFLRALRDELQSEVKYGSVRERDALQYLIDHFEGGGGLDVDADVTVDTELVADASDDGSDDAGEETSADGGAVAASATVDGSGDGEDSSSGSSSSSSPQSGDDRLNAMMNLLDTHDGKWREASKEDARYEVDMPDGTTKYVQTKDDVRALIFKNYD
jgi:hypothetical protein